MKFEYELNYDFVKGELSFKITKMPEKYRATGLVVKIPVGIGIWKIESVACPSISTWDHTIYLRGNHRSDDDLRLTIPYDLIDANTISEVLKQFQEWVEKDKEVIMTVSEIEKKLGIKNLKIVKEK